MDHPLHLLAVKEIEAVLPSGLEAIKDPACGGNRCLPLYLNDKGGREMQLCKVDCLVLKNSQVKTIIEIEESGFNPTKIFGKFFTSALATCFIQGPPFKRVFPFAEEVLFVQLLDSSKFLKKG